MAKYVFVYHGGKMPESAAESERVMAEWGAWFQEMGDAVVDPGAPVGPSSTVHPGGRVSEDGGTNPVGGYSLVNAENMNAAIALAQSCPILNAEGSVEVAEAMEM